jgi:hypothetical protein
METRSRGRLHPDGPVQIAEGDRVRRLDSTAEHVQWLIERAAERNRADTDELWTLLYYRLDGNRPLTNRVWREYATQDSPFRL